jgi:hypothetical protein
VGVSPVFAKANTEPLAGSGRPCLGMRCPVKKYYLYRRKLEIHAEAKRWNEGKFEVFIVIYYGFFSVCVY